jgi:transcription-repair coupling factor (superfamily II helicase)
LFGAIGIQWQTIFEATELGAGFRIALKDLEIRGAGNLLGPEQSGYIAAVGFDLYCQLLSEAVKELKARQSVAPGPAVDAILEPMPTIDLPLSAYLPEDYVADPTVRLTLYQRLAKARTVEEVSQIKGELKDRFGSVPAEAENLLYVVNLRVLAAQVGIQSISVEGKEVVIKLKEGRKFDKGRLMPPERDLKVGQSQLRLDMALLGNRWQEVLRKVTETLLLHPLLQIG